MKRVRARMTILLLIVASILSLMLTPAVARAESDYDLIINPLQSLVFPPVYLGVPSTACTKDFSTSWKDDFRNFLNGDELASFDNRVAWVVSGAYVPEGPGGSMVSDRVIVSWWDSTDLPAMASFASTQELKKATLSHGGYMTVGTDCVVYGGSSVRNAGTIAFYDPTTATHPTRPFLQYGVDIDYGDDYEGAIIPTQYTPPPPKYVAMGDSFSSGEGNPSFENGTDESGVNECHRSPYAYPRLLQNDTSLNFGQVSFVACSGATTSIAEEGGQTVGNWNEGSQLDKLSAETDFVTITIGGNDIEFAEFATACVFGSCGFSTVEYQESWGIMTDITRSDNLPLRLATFFSNLSSSLWINPDVKVYVIGYPYVITLSSWENRGLGICSDFDGDEAAAAEDIVSKLDSVINDAVTALDDSRFEYIDPMSAESPFLGHELCTQDSYFHGTEAGLINQAYVFHPKGSGQQAYANLIKSHID